MDNNGDFIGNKDTYGVIYSCNIEPLIFEENGIFSLSSFWKAS